jgi:hypothetical protein
MLLRCTALSGSIAIVLKPESHREFSAKTENVRDSRA